MCRLCFVIVKLPTFLTPEIQHPIMILKQVSGFQSISQLPFDVITVVLRVITLAKLESVPRTGESV
jgi:hypothetical protein